MKYTIQIIHSPEERLYPFEARVVDNEDLPCGWGNTAKEAEKDLVKRLQACESRQPTITKEIDIN